MKTAWVYSFFVWKSKLKHTDLSSTNKQVCKYFLVPFYEDKMAFLGVLPILFSNYDTSFSEKGLKSYWACQQELLELWQKTGSWSSLVLEQTQFPGKGTQSSDTSATCVVNQYWVLIYSQGHLRLRAMPEQNCKLTFFKIPVLHPQGGLLGWIQWWPKWKEVNQYMSLDIVHGYA